MVAGPIAAAASFCTQVVAADGLWAGVARASEDQALRERHLAEVDGQRSWRNPSGAGRMGRRDEASASAETHLRRALALVPGDFDTRRQLAQVMSTAGRRADAIRELEAARRAAPTALEEARIWFLIANERSRLGSYDQALDAYARQLALGDIDPQALINGAELEMALGRLGEAIVRYREAVSIEERDDDRRSAIPGLALGYFGLAVALDRDQRPGAAREAIRRALALDSGLAVLRLAEERGGDLFFVPPGDVSYYLGLAREEQGRTADAVAAFGDYLRLADRPYARRAHDHLARLAAPGGKAVGSERPARPPGEVRQIRLRVVHEATLISEGPLVAPLIDAAWRLDPKLLDACLSVAGGDRPGAGLAAAEGTREFKLTLEVDIDASGRVRRASVLGAAPPTGYRSTREASAEDRAAADSPTWPGVALGSCIEDTVRGRFRVSHPTRKKPTHARIELVLAPVESVGP
jgi:tetratricopeptide (TPR) repeat protein